ncbi:transmembrane 6 superfamily member 2 isoform X2 [Tachyglossus aculeatus]|uniref:transmembrane 6 superfamily member 2 isoform X2 n=1 Tax=Tachyglossus aculeatus TaxID=9261 RepID=UPI0018F70E90|nr:transmembrane 6 superfamily member 2 isoform X2 [Tachyglossus aculeatus]
MEIPPISEKATTFSLLALPVSYGLTLISTSHPVIIALVNSLVLLVLFWAAYQVARGELSHDPLFGVFTVFAFTSVINLLISLEEDGYISGFMEFYVKGEPFLHTAYGLFICYWDGIVHYLLYLLMTGAIVHRKSYRNLGLYWLGSLAMSILVFLPGNLLGKYGSEIHPTFLLNIPYILIPCWAGMRIFSQPRALPCCFPERVVEEQKKGLHQRPLDLALVLYLLLAMAFTLFRGLVALDCPADSCFFYIYQYEPYLRDPVAYPKVQMLVYMYYALPFFCLAVYGLFRPGCSWLPDWALVFAGAIGQAQFSHIGSSLHHRTSYTYRTPEDARTSFFFSNLLYVLGPHILAFRCLRRPNFFLNPGPHHQEGKDKKRQ